MHPVNHTSYTSVALAPSHIPCFNHHSLTPKDMYLPPPLHPSPTLSHKLNHLSLPPVTFSHPVARPHHPASHTHTVNVCNLYASIALSFFTLFFLCIYTCMNVYTECASKFLWFSLPKSAIKHKNKCT
jgi:hypothetical protein